MLYRSAGFLSSGNEMPPDLAGVLSARHIDAGSHRSYTIDKASVAAADLLLTMEGSHVQQATVLEPSAFAKIVPLKEAAAVLDRLAPAKVSIEQFVEELNRDRDPRKYLGTAWDVDDPYGKRTKAYQRAVEEIDQLVTMVIGRLE